MNKEIWKEIPLHQGYFASSFGRIRSKTGNIINGSRLKNRYILVYVDGKRYLKHRLIGEAFLPNPNNLPCINHKDENPENNRPDNLEWCTPAYNNSYGSHPQKLSEGRKGKKHSKESRKLISQKLNDFYNRGGRPSNCLPIIVLKNGVPVGEYADITTASKALGMKSETSIVNVLKGRSKTGYGYTFMYKIKGS